VANCADGFDQIVHLISAWVSRINRQFRSFKGRPPPRDGVNFEIALIEPLFGSLRIELLGVKLLFSCWLRHLSLFDLDPGRLGYS
jgi:hypothetical protein